MTARVSADQLSRDLAVRDLTDPAEGPHSIQLIVDRAVRALAQLWGCEVRSWRGDRIVTIEDNYDCRQRPIAGKPESTLTPSAAVKWTSPTPATGSRSPNAAWPIPMSSPGQGSIPPGVDWR